MYHQRFQSRPDGGSRGPRFGGFPFHSHGCNRSGGRRFNTRFVPVNIETTAESFVLTLFAAGLSKDKIQLSVQGDVLTVAYAGGAPPAGGPHYTHQEMSDLSFERTFQLNGKVLTENLSARYADGVLTVTLPRDPATNPPAQTIEVG